MISFISLKLFAIFGAYPGLKNVKTSAYAWVVEARILHLGLSSHTSHVVELKKCKKSSTCIIVCMLASTPTVLEPRLWNAHVLIFVLS